MSNPYREKLLGVGFLSRGRSTDRHVVEGRDANGDRFKAVTDQAGNTVTEHDNRLDQVDVHVRSPHIRIGGSKEVPHDG
jgi:hypothetical protein